MRWISTALKDAQTTVPVRIAILAAEPLVI